MSDWRNTIPMVVNKVRFQLYAGKHDNLDKVSEIFQQSCSSGRNSLDKHELAALLKKIGVFLTTQETTPVLNVFDLDRDGRVHFAEFVQTLRVAYFNKELNER